MKKISKIIIISLVLVLMFGVVYSSAYVPYETYTYSISGTKMKSPSAYEPTSKPLSSSDMGLSVPIKNATDLATDESGNVYIADPGNKRIVILNKYYKVIKEITGYKDIAGRDKSFVEPTGIFISTSETSDGDNYLYVCDKSGHTEDGEVGGRILVYNESFEYIKTLENPGGSSDDSLLKASDFMPESIAVDKYGRIFVSSTKVKKGIIVLSNEGVFTSYIGAQKINTTFFDRLINEIFPEDSTDTTISSKKNFRDITVDSDGFVYVTVTAEEADDRKSQLSSITTKSSDGSPVKKLNSTGKEILNRNGFFDPGGEVDVFTADEVSYVNDITLGPEGTWTIVDANRARFFTYDASGNLLFAFGDGGKTGSDADLRGNNKSPKGIAYQFVDEEIDGVTTSVPYFLVLDDAGNVGYRLTVYAPSEYCNNIIQALKNQNEHDYDTSIDYWQTVLSQNNNFDLAYIGIGKAYFSQRMYEEAYEVLQNAYETDYASKAFSEIRKDAIGSWIILIAIVAIALVVGFVKFLGYAKKKNKATTLKVGRKTYWEELLFSFHLVFHPFDGFWDLKHEKRGSVRAASTILGLTVLAMFYNSIGQGYLFNPEDETMSVFAAIGIVIIPVMLWIVANWCLTTLFDGEGSFKDIYIATCYSLAPLPLFLVISTILTNVLTNTESAIVSLITTIGFIWAVILIFFGTLVTHDYSFGKNFITVLGTILAMIIIAFLIILFGSLILKMVTFVIAIITEVGSRL